MGQDHFFFKEIKILNELQAIEDIDIPKKKVIKVGLSPSKKFVLALMKTVYKRGKIICILS